MHFDSERAIRSSCQSEKGVQFGDAALANVMDYRELFVEKRRERTERHGGVSREAYVA
jgi:hypothetical protein